MGEEPNQPTPEDYDATLAEISRHMDEELERGGPFGSVGPAGTGGSGFGGIGDVGDEEHGGVAGEGTGTAGGVLGHWALTGLALLVAMAVDAALAVYVNFPVALLAGVVLTGIVVSLATQSGYRKGLRVGKAADIAFGLGAMLAVLSLSYFAPIFYLAGAGKEGVTSDVLVTHGSRNSVTCHAVLPNDKTAKVSCLHEGDKNRLSEGHYRVVYDPHGHTEAWPGTKSDLPVALGGALIVGGLVVSGIGVGLEIAGVGRGGPVRRAGLATG